MVGSCIGRRSSRKRSWLGFAAFFRRRCLDSTTTTAITDHAGRTIAAEQIAEEVEDRSFARLACRFTSWLFASRLTSWLFAGRSANVATDTLVDSADRAASGFASRLTSWLLAGRFAGRFFASRLASVASNLTAYWASQGIPDTPQQSSDWLGSARIACGFASGFGNRALSWLAGDFAGRSATAASKQVLQPCKQVAPLRLCTWLARRFAGWFGTRRTAFIETHHAAKHVGCEASAAQHCADHQRSQEQLGLH